jgi:hypothetical protein
MPPARSAAARQRAARRKTRALAEQRATALGSSTCGARPRVSAAAGRGGGDGRGVST